MTPFRWSTVNSASTELYIVLPHFSPRPPPSPAALLLPLSAACFEGTYIKEFVHGDLGRTVPSIGSLLNCRADILQLDVTDVEDKWSAEEEKEGGERSREVEGTGEITLAAAERGE